MERTVKEIIIDMSEALSEILKNLMDGLANALDKIMDHVITGFQEQEKKSTQSIIYWKNPKHDARIKSQVLINKPLRVCARTNC